MKGLLIKRQSWLIASGLAAALTAWMLSGMLGGDASDKAADQAAAVAEDAPARDPLMQVRVQTSRAEAVLHELVISGRTEPARTASLRAEIDARIIGVDIERGMRVQRGQVIVRLDPRDLDAQRAEANALIAQRELQYQAALRLKERQMQPETAVAEALANLEAARARLSHIDVQVQNTVIRAPFDGVLDRRPVEVGDYAKAGDTIAVVLEQDPILVSGYINEQEVQFVAAGDAGTARLVTGEALAGTVRYVASDSDEATRTFRIELEVANPDGRVVSGITAEIRIPSRAIDAHFLSAALLSLNDAGEIGVKAVNSEGIVEFHPVHIARSGAEGIWVTGLPPTLQVITIGHGFVHPGDRVRAIPAGALAESLKRKGEAS
jgi:multidrug efflux system membrane fusion protein